MFGINSSGRLDGILGLPEERGDDNRTRRARTDPGVSRFAAGMIKQCYRGGERKLGQILQLAKHLEAEEDQGNRNYAQQSLGAHNEEPGPPLPRRRPVNPMQQQYGLHREEGAEEEVASPPLPPRRNPVPEHVAQERPYGAHDRREPPPLPPRQQRVSQTPPDDDLYSAYEGTGPSTFVPRRKPVARPVEENSSVREDRRTAPPLPPRSSTAAPQNDGDDLYAAPDHVTSPPLPRRPMNSAAGEHVAPRYESAFRTGQAELDIFDEGVGERPLHPAVAQLIEDTRRQFLEFQEQMMSTLFANIANVEQRMGVGEQASAQRRDVSGADPAGGGPRIEKKKTAFETQVRQLMPDRGTAARSSLHESPADPAHWDRASAHESDDDNDIDLGNDADTENDDVDSNWSGRPRRDNRPDRFIPAKEQPEHGNNESGRQTGSVLEAVRAYEAHERQGVRASEQITRH